MVLEVRNATPDDSGDITNICCSDVEKWYKIRGNKRTQAEYEDLTPYERWIHGGPWLDATLCKRHLEKSMTELGAVPLVADLDGECVGEAEFMLCREPEPYLDYGYLSTLVVHKDFRRQGVGTKLVGECIERTQRAGFSFFDTVPEDERSLKLYKNLGLMKWKEFPVLSLSIKKEETANSVEGFVELNEVEDPTRDYTVVIDHWSPAKSTWRYLFDEEHRSLFSALTPRVFRLNLESHEVIVALDHWEWNKKAGKLIVLIEPYSSPKETELKQIVTAVRDVSSEMGFKSVDARGVDTDVISRIMLGSLGFSSKPAFRKQSFQYLRRQL